MAPRQVQKRGREILSSILDFVSLATWFVHSQYFANRQACLFASELSSVTFSFFVIFHPQAAAVGAFEEPQSGGTNPRRRHLR
jgi:hypothetical protein